MTMKTQIVGGHTKKGHFHLRFGGYGTYKIKTYDTEAAARKALVGWLDELADLERKFDTEATDRILSVRGAIKNLSVPIQCELKGGLGNPFVARVWEEKPSERPGPAKTTIHEIHNHELKDQ